MEISFHTLGVIPGKFRKGRMASRSSKCRRSPTESGSTPSRKALTRASRRVLAGRVFIGLDNCPAFGGEDEPVLSREFDDALVGQVNSFPAALGNFQQNRNPLPVSLLEPERLVNQSLL